MQFLGTVGFSLKHIDSWVRQRKLNSKFVEAVEKGDFCACLLLLGNQAAQEPRLRTELDCRNADSWTLLHIAANDSNVKIARLLLDHGANVNAQTPQQRTPLHFASQRGSLECTRLLIGHGADTNA